MSITGSESSRPVQNYLKMIISSMAEQDSAKTPCYPVLLCFHIRLSIPSPLIPLHCCVPDHPGSPGDHTLIYLVIVNSNLVKMVDLIDEKSA